jgi:AcrR family transcriptional regulator
MTLTKRQLEIMQVSINLIAEKGIQNMTIKNIADKMHISEPAIYRHFDSKLSILLAILDSFEERFEHIVKEIESKKLKPLDMLEKFYLARCKEFSETPELAKVIFSEEIFQNEQVLSEKIAHIMLKHQKYIVSLIRKASNNGEIRTDIPEEHMSLFFMGSLRLIVTRWRLVQFNFDLVEKGSEIWKSFKKLIEKEA